MNAYIQGVVRKENEIRASQRRASGDDGDMDNLSSDTGEFQHSAGGHDQINERIEPFTELGGTLNSNKSDRLIALDHLNIAST